MRRCCAPSGTRAAARTATSRWRSTRRSRTTARRRSRGEALHEWIDEPNLYVKIPATEPGPRRDRGVDRAGPQHQRDADLLARALRGGRRGVHPRARAVRRGRRRPVDGRAPSRRSSSRASTPRPTSGSRRSGRDGAPGQARDREREARVRALQGASSPASAGRRSPRRARRRSAASGRRRRRRTRTYRDVMYVEELIGPDDGEHDAGGDDPRVPGSRQGRARRSSAGLDKAQAAVRRAASGRRRLRRRDRHARARGRAEVQRLVRRAARRDRRKRASSPPREPTSRSSSGSGRCDPTVWTGRRGAGSAGSTARACAAQLDELNAFSDGVDARVRRRRAARHGRLVARARGDAAAFDVEAFHVLDTTHPRRSARSSARSTPSGRSSSPRRSRAATIETRSHSTTSWSAAAGGAVRRDHRSRLGARELARERGFLGVFPGEPTIGGRYSALSPFGIVPAALMGVDVDRLLERAEEMREACRCADGNPGLELGLALGEGWREGRDKVALDESATVRSLGGAAARRVDRQAGQGPRARAGRVAGRADRQRGELDLADPYELGQEFFRWEFATAVAGHSSASIPSTSRTCRRRRTRPTRCSSGVSSSSSLQGSLDELLAQARRGRLRLHPGVHRPGARARAGAARRARARDRLRRDARPRAALPALDRAAAQGRPEHRPLRPGRGRPRRGAADPGPRVRLRASDPRAGRRRLRGARRSAAAASFACDWRTSRCSSGMVGLGRMGGNMTIRLERARPRDEDVRPRSVGSTAESLRELATSSSRRARLADDPGGRRRPRTRSRSCSACSRPATRSSTAATRTSATRSAATPRRAKKRHPLRRRRRLGRHLGAARTATA